eukprot:CAMPEP_0117426572 /NCGR_PEP_ID=MMETSP0758-20121206/6641_1 /TAXON_ID=63605 /ORGANISM="Percolomonas cosmopolitus, Strain AE-1 (ATCC 50343)" /LENGTH=272 /DNA_ID=CAMNT_0005211785 /DNA_START=128 /DNA_END=946 /DNA_ORIENTATION=-
MTNPPIDKLLQEPLLEYIGPLYKQTHKDMQYDLFWIIHNLSIGDEIEVKPLLETYFLEEALDIISVPETKEARFVDLALSFIGNICCTDSEIMIAKGVIPPLIKLTNYQNELRKDVRIRMYVAWITSRITKAQAKDRNIINQFLPIIETCIYDEDTQIQSDATWSVHYICAASEHGIQMVLETSITKQLVSLMMHPEETISLPALKALGDIVRGNDYQTQQVINVGFINALIPLIHKAKVPSMISELCWILGNLTAGDINQTEEVLKTNIGH